MNLIKISPSIKGKADNETLPVVKVNLSYFYLNKIAMNILENASSLCVSYDNDEKIKTTIFIKKAKDLDRDTFNVSKESKWSKRMKLSSKRIFNDLLLKPPHYTELCISEKVIIDKITYLKVILPLKNK